MGLAISGASPKRAMAWRARERARADCSSGAKLMLRRSMGVSMAPGATALTRTLNGGQFQSGGFRQGDNRTLARDIGCVHHPATETQAGSPGTRRTRRHLPQTRAMRPSARSRSRARSRGTPRPQSSADTPLDGLPAFRNPRCRDNAFQRRPHALRDLHALGRQVCIGHVAAQHL